MKKLAYVVIGVFVLSLITMIPTTIAQEEKPVFKYGYGSGDAKTLDPADAWDSASIDILDQVMEGLVGYDLFDPELAIEPVLATDLGTWNDDATNVTFTLRQGVTFHDGSKFNATNVNYTFARLTHMMLTNVGPVEDEIFLSQLGELYKPLAAMHPEAPFVIKDIVINSEYSVTFVLNYAYVAFIPLLCFSGSYIVHPDMPFNASIGVTGELIGTGPYVLEEYSIEGQHFVAYEDYWRALPNIREMRWIKFIDSVALAQGFLNGDVDMPESYHPDFIEQFEASADIYTDPPKKGTSIYYFGLNNKLINSTLREAMSYAIDYDYLITNILNNQVQRMISPIPEGILYHDPTVVVPTFNKTKARQVLIDAGLTTLSVSATDRTWQNLAYATPIAHYNFTYNLGNRVRGDMGLLVQSNLANIGILVDLEGISWPQYLDAMYYYFDRLNIYSTGWGADYNDPSNFINPLLSNTSSSNSAQVNDHWLQDAMMLALAETNTTTRRAMYSEIQHYVVEELRPWLFCYVSIAKFGWSVHLTNYPRNPMGKRYFYPCLWYEEEDTTPTTPAIPGYSFVALLGVAAVTVGVLLYKRRR
jgi:peptide/nickel transport system substrate-binding protein